MSNDLRVLRDEFVSRMSATVSEISIPKAPSSTWQFRGNSRGVECSIEDVGFWLISILPGEVVVEVVRDDAAMIVFLESFDLVPLELVISRWGVRRQSWWLSFDGSEFGQWTAVDRLIASRNDYREARVEIKRDAVLPYVE